jgi:para-nitrobenzyl esterase
MTRMKTVFSLLLILLLGTEVRSQQKTTPGYTPPDTITVRLPSGMLLHKNLRYGPIPDSTDSPASDRILDMYVPASAGPMTKVPLFLFIHGGGFTGGDKAMTDLCTKIAAQGYAVASINYRLTLKNKKVPGSSCSANMSTGLPAGGAFHPLLQQAVQNASQDAALALNWLTKHSENYPVNTQEVVVCGGSAGAMTALNLAYVLKPANVKIKAVVNFWGGLEDASVIEKGSAPLLTYHGDRDDLIHVDYAHALAARMNAIGSKQSKLVIMTGKGHAQYQFIANTKVNEIAEFLQSL